MLNLEYKKFVTVGLTDTHIEYLKSYMAWLRQMTGEDITWNQAIMICVDKCLEAFKEPQELKQGAGLQGV